MPIPHRTFFRYSQALGNAVLAAPPVAQVDIANQPDQPPLEVVPQIEGEHILAQLVKEWKISATSGFSFLGNIYDITSKSCPSGCNPQEDIIRGYVYRYASLCEYSAFLKRGGDVAAVFDTVVNHTDREKSFLLYNGFDAEKAQNLERIKAHILDIDVSDLFQRLETQTLHALTVAIKAIRQNERDFNSKINPLFRRWRLTHKPFDLEDLQIELRSGEKKRWKFVPGFKGRTWFDSLSYTAQDLRLIAGLFALFQSGERPSHQDLDPVGEKLLKKIEAVFGTSINAARQVDESALFFIPYYVDNQDRMDTWQGWQNAASRPTVSQYLITDDALGPKFLAQCKEKYNNRTFMTLREFADGNYQSIQDVLVYITKKVCGEPPNATLISVLRNHDPVTLANG